MNKKTFRELVPESAEWQTFVDVLRSHAQSRGNEVAYVYLKDGETEGARITFAELDAKVRAIAAKLQQSTCPGDRVLLMFAPGIEYISAYLGCLYAGVIAIPAYPPRNKRYLARFQSIVSDSQAAIGLTSSDLLPNIVTMFAQAQGLQMLKLISTDDMELSLADGWQTVDISGATTAFLQYTSGSTGSPKGVIVSHGNLLHNEQVIVTHTDMAQSHGIVSWVPPYHDLGLILGLLCPLYMGKKSVIMAPFAFIQSPYRWLKAISDFSDQKICSGAPNFAYDLCSRRITAEQKATLDLSHWDVAFNGAEPISAQTYDRFVDAFAECGFQPNARYPVYGLAESTLMTAGGPPQTPMVVLNLDSEALGQNRVSIVEANEQSRQHVGCGQVNLEQEIHIVDPDTHLECSGHRVGEIWVKGGSIAQGYWNRPQETANSFHAMIKESQLGPFLRTGDLGFVHEGELFVTGRIKDVIIVRGRNHYPQDIENTVATADPSQGKGITPIRFGNVAAIAVTEDGLEKVVVVAEVERHYLQTCRRFQTEDHIEAPEEVSDYRTLDPNIVIGVIRQEVAEVHDIQLAAVVLIRPERLPKTSSGKIQHHQTGVDYQNGDLPVVWHSEFSKPDTCHDDIVVIIEQISPEDICLDRLLVMPIDERANWLKQALQSHVARSLHLAMEVIDSEMPLSQLGIDSLIAVEMGHLIESGFSVQIDSFALLDGMTLSELVESVLGQLQEEATSDTPPLVRIEEFHPEYPLSQGQRAMWFLHRFAPENLAYNVTIPAKIEQPLNMPVLQRAFQALLDRHPALRTTYHSKEGEPVVYVEEDSQLFFTLEDASGWSQNAIDDWLKKLAKTPFDLENGPLFRVNVVSDGDTCYLLMSAHHIAVDMWSVVILMDELKLYYAAYLTGEQITLPELPYRYTDYVQWQIQLLKSDAGDRMWQYWKNQLAGCHPILELPTDRPRPPVQTYQGDTVSLELNSAVTDRVKSFAKETNTTVYMVLLGAFQVLLHRYTGQQDLLVGSPVAGRTKAGLEGVVGYFVDPVVLRAKFRHGENFIDFMQQVKQTVLGALSNQDYPFSEIVKRIYPARDPSRSPLFQALFVLQKTYQMKGESISGFVLGEAGGRLNMADVALESMSIETQVAMFDIMLTMTEGDGQLRGSFQYNSDLFEQSTIAIMALHLETLLQGLLSESDSPMSDIPLMTEADRYLLTVEWNDHYVDYPLERSLNSWFESFAESSPESIAVRYEQASITYQALNERANQLARYLQSNNVADNLLVGVCVHRSIDMIVAILAVLKAGGAYVPLDPGYPVERLTYMCEDAKLSLVLTNSQLCDAMPQRNKSTMIPIDTLDLAEFDKANIDMAFDPEQLAYIIYTSGSTGRPKGVMIPHRAIVNHMLWMLDALNFDSNDVVLQKTPFSFDASIWEFFAPLMVGGTLVMAKPDGHRDGAYLLEAIKQYNVTTIQLVPSALRMLLETIGIESISSLKRVCCGGEALTLDLQKQHYERLDVPLFNLYGPTEATIDSTFWECDPRYLQNNLPIGRPISNAKIYILDKSLNPVPVGVPGEIHISGQGLASGYLYRPELTDDSFISNPFEADQKLYKSGDLGRYLHDGSIEFLGRIDHQVKLRGYRIEMGEVEAAINDHPAVRQSVTLVREDVPGNKRLVTYVISDPVNSPTTEEMKVFLKNYLPIYMIPNDIVILDALPLMPNGKVDRLALPAPSGMQMDDAYIAPGTPLELALVEIWGQVLGAIRVGVEDNFFEFGGHSLLATQVVARIYDRFALEVPVRALFEHPTIADLSRHIEKHYRHQKSLPKTDIKVITRSEFLPVSSAQKRLWFLHHLLENTSVYNMPAAISMKGKVNIDALKFSLNTILNHHEVLKTGYLDQLGEPVAFVAEVDEVPFTVIEVEGDTAEVRQAEAKRLADEEGTEGFDLTAPPLIRAKLLVLDEDDYLFLFTMHHIVSDGWSLGLFCSEFLTAYKAFIGGKSVRLSALPIQYIDYSAWQNTFLTDEVLAKQIEFWRDQIGAHGDVPVLNLPTDYPRPLVQSYQGAQCLRLIPFELIVGLEELSERNGASLGMTLFAAFNVLLYRYSGQREIMVGFPIANRTRVEVEHLIGLFVNTLAIKTTLDDDIDFQEQVRRVRDVFFGAFSNQDVPYERLVDELDPQRDTSRSPLFQVMFTMQNTPLEAFSLPDVDAELFHSHNGTAKFDLWLSLSESQEGMIAQMEYNTDLFEEATIERILSQLQVLLNNIIRQPETPIAKISLLPESEKNRLVNEWNDTQVDFPERVCVHQLFEDQAEYTPDAIAVTLGHEKLTYRELNEKANQLAHWLRMQNVGPNISVGIHLPRSIELVISMLAVAKSGGCYIPFDASCPKDRIEQMLQDAKPLMLMTDSIRGRQFKRSQMQLFLVDEGWEDVLTLSTKNLISGVSTNDPMYQIYTSGSTGAMKGVVVPHKAAYNHMQWMQREFELSESDRMLQRSPMSFDASVTEFWLPLLSGGELVLEMNAAFYNPTLCYLGGIIAEWKRDYDQIEALNYPVMVEDTGAWKTEQFTLSPDLHQKLQQYCDSHSMKIFECLIGLQAWWVYQYCRPEGYFPVQNADNQVLYVFSPELFHEVATCQELWARLNRCRTIYEQLPLLCGICLDQPVTTGKTAFYYTDHGMINQNEESSVWLSSEQVGSDLRLTLTYHSHHFTDFGFFNQLQQLLVQIVESPVTLGMLSLPVERSVIEPDNKVDSEPVSGSLVQRFEAMVEAYPLQVAVGYDDVQLTYAELEHRSNQMAHCLLAMGVEQETYVGLFIDRSVDQVIAMLAVLKAGGCYVPLDPTAPEDMVEWILEDTEIPLVITQPRHVKTIKGIASQDIEILETQDKSVISQPNTSVNISISSSRLAYVIYTSGSTGKPKGVMVEHAQILSLMDQSAPLFDFDHNDVWAMFHSCAFDFSVWEAWGALMYGGRLVLVPDSCSQDAEAFYQLLVKEKVTILNQTPSEFYQLISAEEQLFRSADNDENALVLREVIFGGEVLDYRKLKPWVMRHGDSQPKLSNMYGITETTVHVTCRPVTQEDVDFALRTMSTLNFIGQPINGLKLHILDAQNRPVAVGVPGEICVSGEGVARGYHNRAGLTASRFVQLPGIPGKLYRSGDLARYLPSGEVQYLGRMDHQVQLRGYRIELGEVESAIAAFPGVKENITIVKDDRHGEPQIVCYIVKPTNIEFVDIRQFIKLRIPEYMIPSSFVSIDVVPLTANGKIDYAALPAPNQVENQVTTLNEVGDAKRLIELILSQQITLLQVVPTLLRELVAQPQFSECTSLRTVFCGGEVFPQELAQQFFSRLSCQLINLYGPAEATIDATFGVADKHHIGESVPIGQPINNNQVYVLDQHLNVVPTGVVGELFIAGEGLSSGYLNQMEMTQARFIHNPFSSSKQSRLYQTGDLVRWLATGELEYVGRSDLQIKIRGYRVELEEIEAVLNEHPAVHESVVVARKDEKGQMGLVAYLVSSIVADRVLFKISCTARVEGHDPVTVTTEDISKRGLKLMNVPSYWQKGQRVSLELENFPQVGKITGKMVWCQSGSAGILLELSEDVGQVSDMISGIIADHGFNLFDLRRLNVSDPRRSRLRVPLHQQCQLKLMSSGHLYKVDTEDLSVGYIRLKNVPKECRQDDLISLLIALPGESVSSWVEGKLLWVNNTFASVQLNIDKETQVRFYQSVLSVMQSEHYWLSTHTMGHLRRYLNGYFPEFLVPKSFVHLDGLPLLDSGKVDRAALPAPEHIDSTEKISGEAETDTEKALAKIWCEVLSIDKVNRGDSFFELGGHSLLVTQVLSRILSQFSCKIPLQVFFDEPTLEGLSKAIDLADKVADSQKIADIKPLTKKTRRRKKSNGPR